MLYIRVDMNDSIATGHIMRCRAIADAAREQGEETTFLLADHQAADILDEWGYSYIILGTDWKDLGSELFVLEKAILENKIECLLIDTYQVTESYLCRLSEMTKTVYIDDLNAFLYPVDAIICYVGYWEKFQYNMRYPGKQLLLGPQFAPLRSEFSQCPKKHIKPQIENLVLLSGGTDRYDVLDRLLEKIEKKYYKRITVFCGTYYPKYDYMCEKYKNEKNVIIRKSVNNIKDYMDEADLLISAGGTTLYELCAVGTPAISYSIADNQLENVKAFHDDRIIDYAGDARYDDIIGNILNYLELYYSRLDLRAERSRRMQELVDGKGAGRIARFLQNIK